MKYLRPQIRKHDIPFYKIFIDGPFFVIKTLNL